MIVRFEDFEREAKIPDLFPPIGGSEEVNLATQKELISFICQYEHRYLVMFFSSETQAKSIEEYNSLSKSQQTDVRKNILIDNLRKVIANYVAFHYFRHQSVVNSSVGAIVINPQNSKRTDIVDRCVYVWNEMVDRGRSCYREYFGKSCCSTNEIFCKINSFTI